MTCDSKINLYNIILFKEVDDLKYHLHNAIVKYNGGNNSQFWTNIYLEIQSFVNTFQRGVNISRKFFVRKD
jgi:hypothetical protein